MSYAISRALGFFSVELDSPPSEMMVLISEKFALWDNPFTWDESRLRLASSQRIRVFTDIVKEAAELAVPMHHHTGPRTRFRGLEVALDLIASSPPRRWNPRDSSHIHPRRLRDSPVLHQDSAATSYGHITFGEESYLPIRLNCFFGLLVLPVPPPNSKTWHSMLTITAD
ncbi:hypothetical protein TNCV_406621 [Trichonephila clavipes]|nr:hypothetical protein TNCV_406621 [Trichonephila clavipes]